jgi:hypothetical protein
VNEPVLISKVANALIPEASSRLGGPVDSALERVRRRDGGLWVGGRVTLTERELRFAANALNRGLQSGTLDVRIDLDQIRQVEVIPAPFTKIIEVHSGQGLLKFRCYGAARFAQAIRGAVAA